MKVLKIKQLVPESPFENVTAQEVFDQAVQEESRIPNVA